MFCRNVSPPHYQGIRRVADAFLSPADVERLTGVRRPSAQIRFLRSRRIRHIVNRAGHPVIAKAWLIGQDAEVVEIQRPNLQVLKRA